ncbi:MAG: formate/nitrite transporter family protein [Planctomycetaceae bacterium]|nr:formate/nitrite transporter family protein [Planctomycetaceae bacterium]
MPSDDRSISFDAFAPAEIAHKVEKVGVAKARLPLLNTLLLAILAGAFIGLGGYFAIVAGTGSELGFGPTKVLVGTVFSLGLILVVVAGAELFTGNNLVAMAWASKSVTTREILRNWTLVYVGNFIGAGLTAWFVFLAGTWKANGSAVGLTAVGIAAAKCQIGFVECVFRGILCNALVCLAVWLCLSGRSTTDKILAIIWPIAAFVAVGFEHSVANMFFLPLGLLLKSDAGLSQIAAQNHLSLHHLGATAAIQNLIPVTIGNIIGGTLLVAGVYWLIFLRSEANQK